MPCQETLDVMPIEGLPSLDAEVAAKRRHSTPVIETGATGAGGEVDEAAAVRASERRLSCA